MCLHAKLTGCGINLLLLTGYAFDFDERATFNSTEFSTFDLKIIKNFYLSLEKIASVDINIVCTFDLKTNTTVKLKDKKCCFDSTKVLHLI